MKTVGHCFRFCLSSLVVLASSLLSSLWLFSAAFVASTLAQQFEGLELAPPVAACKTIQPAASLAGGHRAVTTPVNPEARQRARGRDAVPGKSPVKNVAVMAWRNLPLGFERNRGQFGAGVDFGAQVGDGTISLFGGELTVARGGAKAVTAQANDALRMWLVGTSPARGEGKVPLGAQVNYLLGDDPRRWVAGAQTFARVRYPAVDPGIDLVYYGNGRELEYD